MDTVTAALLHRPTDPTLGYLGEGPYALGENRLSWVSIQRDPDSVEGALNRLDAGTGINHSTSLRGRPGFAFPTSDTTRFLVGLERRVAIVDLQGNESRVLASEVDGDVQGTIINDGVVFDAGVIFGTKDLTFSTRKAGLYLLRRRDLRLFRWRSDQICSNGKIVRRLGPGRYELLDIDTPTKSIARYEFDLESGEASPPTVAVDLTHLPTFPDGMIQVPGRESVIVAMFDPRPESSDGEALQVSLVDGSIERRWVVPGSPQVTCPQLCRIDGHVRLVLTTATENMSPERVAALPDAGSLFVAEAPVDDIGDQPVWPLD